MDVHRSRPLRPKALSHGRKGIGIWDGIMRARDQIRQKMPTRFVIPAGDTLALLAMVVPSGSWTCVKRRRLL